MAFYFLAFYCFFSSVCVPSLELFFCIPGLGVVSPFPFISFRDFLIFHLPFPEIIFFSFLSAITIWRVFFWYWFSFLLLLYTEGVSCFYVSLFTYFPLFLSLIVFLFCRISLAAVSPCVIFFLIAPSPAFSLSLSLLCPLSFVFGVFYLVLYLLCRREGPY